MASDLDDMHPPKSGIAQARLGMYGSFERVLRTPHSVKLVQQRQLLDPALPAQVPACAWPQR